MEMKLFALWKNSLFPFVLGGEFTKMDDYGRVYIPSYQSWFTPIKILPLEAGQNLLHNLLELRCAYKDEHTNVDNKFKNKLCDLMPEAIKK